MTTQQLLKELLIRFDTNPKLYLKLDYQILIKLLKQLADTNGSEIISILTLLVADVAELPTKLEVLQICSSLKVNLEEASEEDIYNMFDNYVIYNTNLTVLHDASIAGTDLTLSGTVINNNLIL